MTATLEYGAIYDAAKTLLGNELSVEQATALGKFAVNDPIPAGGDWQIGYASLGDVASIRIVGPDLPDLETTRHVAKFLRANVPIPHSMMAVHVPTMTGHDLDHDRTMTVIPPGDDCESGGFDIDMGDGDQREGAD